VVLRDLNSRNGTFVNGEMVAEAHLHAGDEIQISAVTLRVLTADEPDDKTEITDLFKTQLGVVDVEGTVVPEVRQPPVVDVEGTVVPEARRQSIVAPPPLGTIPDEILKNPIISERALVDAGIEVKVTEYAALGGGMGSFVFVDLLRNSGVSAGDIVVVGNEDKPHSHYKRLATNSQIPLHERIRSNSESCPDNIWGFPGYAVREAWIELTLGHLGTALSTIWATFGEPVLTTTYTPRLGHVMRSIDHETARIGWQQMLRRGRIRAIRKSEEGRLVAIVSASDERQRKHFAISARFAQLAVGYPAIELLPELAAYREKYGEFTRVVNAYEQHDHIYNHLRLHGGTVLLRGRGIVASRIVQRLWEERQHNKNIVVVHLHRSRLTRGHRYGVSRRKIDGQWEFQPFNWPKACWGGEYRERLERGSNPERKQLLEIWGGTTTADRPDWRRIIREGTREGWYRSEFGVVNEVRPTPDGRVLTRVDSRLAAGGVLEITTDFVIDCTGLVASPNYAPFLADLIQTYNLARNPLGRLQVTNDFEIEGMRYGEAHLYACGALTLGGPHAGVDTFLALQYCALAAARDMLRYAPNSPKGLHHLRGLYSFGQWLKWSRGKAP
jgi:pSer/pThr/pTyr-binding forkhead associated (FHA) protein